MDTIEVQLAKKSIDRKKTSLDVEAKNVLNKSGTNQRLAKDNMLSYMDNYAIKYPLPALYVLNAKVFRIKPSYSIQLIKYVFPQNEDYNIITHKSDFTYDISKYSKDEQFK